MTDARFQFLVIVITSIAGATAFAIKVFQGKSSNAEKLTELINDVKVIKDEITVMKQASLHDKANIHRLETLVNSLLEHILEFISGKKK